MLKFWGLCVCNLVLGRYIFTSFSPVYLGISLMAGFKGLSEYPENAVFLSLDV